MNLYLFTQIKTYAERFNVEIEYVSNIGTSVFIVKLPATKTQPGTIHRFNDLQYSNLPTVYEQMTSLIKDWALICSLKHDIKKKEIEQFIRNKIKTDDRWALRTLIIMYQKQTITEIRDEQTRESNHVGFTGFDSHLMTLFAKSYLSRAKTLKNLKKLQYELNSKLMSKKQMDIIRRTMQKYWRQVYENSDELKLLQQIHKSRDSIQMTLKI
jgi:hypothetical protein